MWEGLSSPTNSKNTPGDSKRACVELARLLESEAEHDAAAAMHAACLARFGADVRLAREASDFHLRAGKLDRSIEILRVAADANPTDLGLSQQLAAVLRSDGRVVEAAAQLETAAKLVDNVDAWRQLGDFHRSVGANGAALEAWLQALGREPFERDALLFALADLYVEENQLERANALRDELKDASLRRIVSGAIALRRGHPRHALGELEAGLADWPNNAGARDLAGQAALALDDTDRAVSHFREAVRAAPGDTNAARRLARIHSSRGEEQLALEFASRHVIMRVYDGDPSAFQIGIRSAIALRRWEEARTLIDMLDRVEPGSEWTKAAKVEIDRLRANRTNEH